VEWWIVSRRAIAVWLIVLVGVAVLVGTALKDPLGLFPNSAPQVIPALREWNGASGYFTLTTASRIVVDPAGGSALQSTAQVFQSDLELVTGRAVLVISSATHSPGDFYLTLSSADPQLGQEGYTFTVGDTAVISAPTAAGVFNATRTALQILMQDSDHSAIPKGTARDYPAYGERGLMLDAGRKFFPLSVLEDYVRFMSWYKLNDLHLHLNDNELNVGNGAGWQQKYAAFRLDSDKFKGLAAKDGSYTKQDMRELQDLAAQYHVTITPEIDAPAHSLAFTQFRPDLVSPKYGKDLLDLSNPNTYTFLDSVWDEFLPWFDTSSVHIGADEYAQGEGDNYRKFINTFDTYLKQKGKSVQMWGSLSAMGGTLPVQTDMTVDVWDTSWASPVDSAAQGFNVVNAVGSLLYIVPKAGYFNDFLDTKTLYNRWDPSIFDFSHSNMSLNPRDPHLLGAMFCDWNDRLGTNISDADVNDRISPAMPVLGDKMWDGGEQPAQALSYDDFEHVAHQLGEGLGTHLAHNQSRAIALSDSSGIMSAVGAQPPHTASAPATTDAIAENRFIARVARFLARGTWIRYTGPARP
jgi:hexosaminidase